GRVQVVEEDRALVVDAVAVGVFQQADAAAAVRRLAGRLIGLEVLDDVEPAVLVEVEGYRAGQQRLGRRQLNAKAGVEANRLQGLRRAFGRDARQFRGIVLLGAITDGLLGRIDRGQGEGCGRQ